MVQAKRNQGTFQNAVDPCTGVTGAKHQRSQMRDTGLYHRPQEEHDDTNEQVHHGRNDRHETSAAEEGKHLRQFNFIEPVVQSRYAQANQNTAEHAHLQCGDTQHRGGGVGCHCFYAALGRDQSTDRGVHDQIGDRTGKSSDFLFFFRHANGNTHGKQQCQIVKDGTSRLAHDVQNGVEQSALIDDVSQMIGFNCSGICKGTSQTQQKPRHRQQCNGKHEGASHSLQYAENLVFHYKSPPKNVLETLQADRVQSRQAGFMQCSHLYLHARIIIRYQL